MNEPFKSKYNLEYSKRRSCTAPWRENRTKLFQFGFDEISNFSANIINHIWDTLLTNLSDHFVPPSLHLYRIKVTIHSSSNSVWQLLNISQFNRTESRGVDWCPSRRSQLRCFNSIVVFLRCSAESDQNFTGELQCTAEYVFSALLIGHFGIHSQHWLARSQPFLRNCWQKWIQGISPRFTRLI